MMQGEILVWGIRVLVLGVVALVDIVELGLDDEILVLVVVVAVVAVG